ncbi:hypothetical protein CCZ01_00745 [Helicobacter monodelphidis]|uniref:manganese efflux pump MntP n=1 Tax=Helicobacter sp. 15-1451 TaxID=2004995 RepID=UPI000DCB2903|nr:manganese efflux pump [Helicobacter sp. 15-1451]RAX59299.1 hypothetical protein CCZ01_00745 [Helicobacter sp. 15-1451]
MFNFAYLDIFFLGVALAIDAMVVAFCYGLILKPYKMSNGIKIAVTAAIFQCFMPILGFILSFVTAEFLDDWITHIDHWISFIIFAILGLKVMKDSWNEGCDDVCGIKTQTLTINMLLMMGIATSIDALCAGVIIFAQQFLIIQSAIFIGLITFVLVLIGFMLSRVLKTLPTRYLGIVGGVVLIFLGVKVLYEHLS